MESAQQPPQPPSHWNVEHRDGATVISKPWGFKAQVVAPAALLLLIFSGQDNPLSMWPAILVSLYWIVLVLKNKTIITLDQGNVTVSYGPIPFRPSRSFNAREAKRIWTKVGVSQMRSASSGATGNESGTYRSHKLILTSQKNVHKTVVETNSKDQADFLEHSVKTMVDYQPART